MNKQKILWERLAKENSRYYINSDKGRNITEEQFKQSGQLAYQKLIAGDQLINDKKSILDFGCGTGRLTQYMAQNFTKVVGVDISGEMIRQGAERLRGIKNIQLVETDGNSIPLPDDSVEVVFSYLVFQHQKERKMVEANFKEIYRVLKPKGIFKVLLRSDRQKDINHWWSGVAFDQQAASKLYLPLGFKLEKMQPIDQYAYWLWLKK